MTQKKTFFQRQGTNLALFLLIWLFFLAFFAHRIFIFVNAGEAGVYFSRFFGGVETTRVYAEGIHVILPWNSMTVYDMRVHKLRVEYQVITSNGLQLNVKISARFHPYYNSLPLLHQRMGPEYIEKVVRPIVESSVRKVIGEHRSEELYSNKGPVLYEINQQTASDLGENFIALEGVVIETIQLPKFIQAAIETREEQRELLEAYGYRLRREKDEALRKEIEAFGWQNFNNILGQSLTPKLLQWRAIEATRQMASSPNAKIVMVGNGEHGMPVILGADYSAGPGPAAQKTTQGKASLKDVLPLARLEAGLSDTARFFDNLLELNNPYGTPPPPGATVPAPRILPSPSSTPGVP